MLYNIPESESKNEGDKGVAISFSLSVVILPICIIGIIISHIASKILPFDVIELIKFIFIFLAFLSLLLLLCSFVKSRFKYFRNINIIIVSFGLSLIFWSLDLTDAFYISAACGFIFVFVFVCRQFFRFLGK